MVRGVVISPHGTESNMMLALVAPEKEDEPKCGADYAGLDEYPKIKEGWTDVDGLLLNQCMLK